MTATIRINKYLASLGIASRRKIDALIDQKRIIVNSQIAKAGLKIDPSRDKITFDGKEIKYQPEDHVYYVLNKPLGILSSVSDNRGRKTVVDLVKTDKRIYPVGRLDYDTSGLILLTNDGDLAYRLTHPKYHFPKQYLVTVAKTPSPEQLDLLRSGVPLEDGITSKSEVEIFHTKSAYPMFKITLYEGKNRQIRRMCTALGLDLLALKRISIGPIHLGNLREGVYRQLSPAELKQLQNL